MKRIYIYKYIYIYKENSKEEQSASNLRHEQNQRVNEGLVSQYQHVLNMADHKCRIGA